MPINYTKYSSPKHPWTAVRGCASLEPSVMLLSEVALGDMYELLHAQYMEKPPAGKHSTKGIGYPAKLSSFKKKMLIE